MPAKRTASRYGLGTPGRRLFDAVTGEYELDEHESSILLQAARTADLLEDLQKQIDRDGVMLRRSFEDNGKDLARRVHPAIAELARQRVVYVRLLAALELPSGLVDAAATPKPRNRKSRYEVEQLSVVPDLPGMA